MIEIGKSQDKSKIQIDLPRLIETRLLIQSMSGGGKSWLIRRLLEQSYGQVQQLVIDLEGEFSSLRTDFDYVIAGKGGDIPAYPKIAKMMSHDLLKLNSSCIMDISELKAQDRLKFVRYFLEGLIDAPKKLRHPALVVIDEAHIFSPERGQAESAPAVIDLCTRGRKRGLCAVLATQRLSKLHKDASAELGNKFIGRTVQDIDRKRAVEELGFTTKQESLSLRKLKPGEFFVYGPAFHEKKSRKSPALVDDIVRVMVGSVKTKHPEVGSKHYEVPPASAKLVKAAIDKLSNIPDEVEKEELSLSQLRKENVELKRTIRQLEKSYQKNGAVSTSELERLKNKYQSDINKFRTAFIDRIEAIRESLNDIEPISNKISDIIQSNIECCKKFSELNSQIPQTEFNPVKITPEKHINYDSIKAPAISAGNGALTNPQQKIINALGTFQTLGIEVVNKVSLAYLSGYSPGTGAFNNYLGKMRTQGLIEYPIPGGVQLTDEGRGLIDESIINATPLSISEYHQHWLKIVTQKSTPLGVILSKVLEIYPNDIGKNELAELTGYQPGTGAFNNYLGKLRNTFKAIEYPSQGRVKASTLLFPDVLARSLL